MLASQNKGTPYQNARAGNAWLQIVIHLTNKNNIQIVKYTAIAWESAAIILSSRYYLDYSFTLGKLLILCRIKSYFQGRQNLLLLYL